MLRHESKPVDTINNIEVIQINDSNFSSLISECKIKLVYVGQNRNGSYMSKETLIKMAPSVRGCPIVGAWREDIEDFGDHGHVITIEDGEVKFSCKTIPYGFVAPDAKVWFQKFIDTDDFGNEVEHEYMVTTGYLWTGQFEEAKKAIREGQGQSVELDDESLNGHWANDSESGMDFFIINDAMFSKLCILGDDVEPCFEGASVTALDSNFANGKEFAHTLYSMIRELQDAIGNREGGLNMPEDFTVTSEGEQVETVEEAVEVEAPVETEELTPEVEEEVEAATEVEETQEVETEHTVTADADSETSEEFVEKKDKADSDTETSADDSSEEEEDKDDDKDDEAIVDSKKKRCSLESEDEKFAAIEAELEELRAFKRAVENKEKDALIDKYHMLSDEEKAEVVAHKEEYTLEQIDEKLALIYVRNNVDFSTVDGHPVEEASESGHDSGLLSFSLDDSSANAGEPVDEIQRSLREMKQF